MIPLAGTTSPSNTELAMLSRSKATFSAWRNLGSFEGWLVNIQADVIDPKGRRRPVQFGV